MGDCVSQTGTRGPQRMSTDTQCLYCKLHMGKRERESKKAGERVLRMLSGESGPPCCVIIQPLRFFFLLNVSLLAVHKITEPQKLFFVSMGVIIFTNLKTKNLKLFFPLSHSLSDAFSSYGTSLSHCHCLQSFIANTESTSSSNQHHLAYMQACSEIKQKSDSQRPATS